MQSRASPAAPPTARVRVPLAAAIAIVAILPLAVWWWAAIVTRTQALDIAVADQRRVTDAVSQHTLGLFESQALVLDLLGHAAGERDCAALRQDAALQDSMAIAAKRLSQADGIWFIDARGQLCISDDPTKIDTRDRSFRDYFTAAQRLKPGEYYVDRAVIGLVDGIPLFNVVKPRFRGGVFNGLILVAIKLTEVRQYWREVIAATPTQRIALFREDGASVTRSWDPMLPPSNPEAEQYLAEKWRRTPEGGVIGPSAIDGASRVGAWRVLPAWHVVVSSSVDETVVLQPWRRSMLTDGLAAVFASVILAALAHTLLRSRAALALMVEQRTMALRTSEQRLSLFIERAPAAIAMFDNELRYLAVSRRYLEDYGLSSAGSNGVLGRRYYDVVPDIPERWREIHRRVLAGETLSADDDALERADGHTDWIRWELAPWFHADGDVGGMVLFSEFVTARRQAELVLSRSKAELEQLVADRTHDLEVTQARLAHAQRMEALGQLAGGIAHDFNNVMQAVQGAAVLAERRAEDQARVRSLSRMIIEASARGAAITRRLLAFARQSDLRSEPIDPASLLAGMEEILAHTIGAAIAVRVHSAPGLPPLVADRGQLETVLVNLATNARDAMPEGGTLTLTAALDVLDHDDGPGHPITLKAGRYVRLRVADTGAGMPPDVLARASEPFFTTKTVGQGTGLGLAMARGFAEQSQGGLYLESETGRGTTVTLWLPAGTTADTPVADASSDAVPSPTPKRPRARLVLVDDDKLVRETLAQELEDEGFAVRATDEGGLALAWLDAGEAVDLVVADLSMPGMDGLTLIREVQRRRPQLPAILLTGFATNAAEIAVSGAMSGAFTLLRKPVSGSVLVERANALLERSTVEE